MKTLIEQVEEFIKFASQRSLGQRTWVENEEARVYIRKSLRHIDGCKMTMLDIAAIDVFDQGKGVWTKFINKICEICPWDGILIENTHNPILRDWCIRHGWFPYNNEPTYYLLRKDSQYNESGPRNHKIDESTV